MTPTELLTRALAIEREAADRYAEFATFMADHGRDDLADLFSQLAALERGHADALEARLGGADAPALASPEDRWVEAGPRSPAAREWLLRLIGPRDALAIALAGERRAREFFARLASSTDDDAVRDLAAELAEEEAAHADRLERLLQAEPDPRIDWARVFGD